MGPKRFRSNLVTAVNIPFDLIIFDSDAASVIVIPSNLSFEASPMINRGKNMYGYGVVYLTKEVLEFAFDNSTLHIN